VKSFVAVLLLMSLAVGGSGNSNKAEATSAAPVGSPAAPAETPALSEADKSRLLAIEGKKWLRKDTTDQMSGDKTAVFIMYGLNVDPAKYENPPQVDIFCSKKLHSAHFDVGPLDNPNVRFKFDDGQVLQQKWNLFQGLWLASPEEQKVILKGFAKARAVKFEYTPVNKAPRMVVFNMADYQESVLKEPLCKK
jgi:hypothetical protein